MRVIVAVDERPDETPLQRVPALLNVRDAEVVIVHVLDPGGREEWERAAGRHLLRPGHPHHGEERMHAADRARGERVLAAAATAAADWGAARVETRLLEGSPKHSIYDLLRAGGADVLVVFVHGREVGPKSIHKEARFLVDHAPCPVLVVKDSSQEPGARSQEPGARSQEPGASEASAATVRYVKPLLTGGVAEASRLQRSITGDWLHNGFVACFVLPLPCHCAVSSLARRFLACSVYEVTGPASRGRIANWPLRSQPAAASRRTSARERVRTSPDRPTFLPPLATPHGVPEEDHTMDVKAAITVNRSPDELYQFWHNFENLPRFMEHLESVQVTGEKRSHWKATAPAGATVEWDAEVVDDRPNELIAWRSLDGAEVNNSGTVRFVPAPDGRGTEAHVEMRYDPPGGALGATVAKLFGEEPSQRVSDDLRHFKQLLETGEIATSDASAKGGGAAQPPRQ